MAIYYMASGVATNAQRHCNWPAAAHELAPLGSTSIEHRHAVDRNELGVTRFIMAGGGYGFPQALLHYFQLDEQRLGSRCSRELARSFFLNAVKRRSSDVFLSGFVR